MTENKKENHLKNPLCCGLSWSGFDGSTIEDSGRIFTFLEVIRVPDMLDLIDLKYFMKDEVRRVTHTRWSINSVVFIDPSPAACASLVKYIYTDFGQIKHQTAFYVGDSTNKKVWLIR